MNSVAEENIEKRAQFFKALGHPARLLIMNLIKRKPRHGEELALILMLNPATVSHHLSILVKGGPVEIPKGSILSSLFNGEQQSGENTLRNDFLSPNRHIAENVEEDAYRKKVLRTFFRRGRIVNIPAQRKKRQIILEEIVEQFEPEKTYLEREVNIILLDFHDDVAALRRGLIEFRLMERTTNGVYTRKFETE